MNEYEVIKKIFSPLSSNNLSLNLDDDAAVLPDKKKIVVGTDSIVEGDHFQKNEKNPSLIAKKLLRANLSDLASMCAEPFGYTLNLSLPNKLKEKKLNRWIKLFAKGLKEDQLKYKLALIGGDTVVTSGPLILSITLFGYKKKKLIKRSNAKLSDDIYVTGNIGDSGVGYKILLKKLSLNKKLNNFYIRKHKLPDPPVEFSKELGRYINSATDISDGLLADLNNIILSSNCGAEINIEKIPFSKQTKELLNLNKINTNYLITCGEDYQLIFTANKKNSKKIISLARKHLLKITKIGSILKKKKLIVLDQNNKELSFKSLGFKHF
ncbi:MAG: thiamine-phosphate kinase [Pelagibacteraceae bacterium]|nr:thiamine-phosphate kinase [Pelagibacteraceae bacterium]|tara:strand:+ start:16307 stop:17278 length:972 start_codon:yes stop_codon:yes gene_type:complete